MRKPSRFSLITAALLVFLTYAACVTSKKTPQLRDEPTSSQAYDPKQNSRRIIETLHAELEALPAAQFMPEYERTLDHVLITVEPYFFRKYSENPSGAIKRWFPQRAVMHSLPPNTHFSVILPPGSDQGILEQLLTEDVLSRTRFHRASLDDGLCSWAQNYGKSNGEILFIPLSYRSDDISRPDNNSLNLLREEGVRVQRLPIDFQGGNIDMVRNQEGEKILFVGYDEFMKTQKIYGNLGTGISEEEYKAVLRKAFGADRVVIAGDEEQPASLYHLDLAFKCLKDGVVAVLNMPVPEQPEERAYRTREWINNHEDLATRLRLEMRYAKTLVPLKVYEAAVALQQHRTILQDNGLRLVDLATDEDHVANLQSYANMVVGRGIILQPLFPDSSGAYPHDGLNRANPAVLRREDFEVIGVFDTGYFGHGNTYCMALIIR